MIYVYVIEIYNRCRLSVKINFLTWWRNTDSFTSLKTTGTAINISYTMCPILISEVILSTITMVFGSRLILHWISSQMIRLCLWDNNLFTKGKS